MAEDLQYKKTFLDLSGPTHIRSYVYQKNTENESTYLKSLHCRYKSKHPCT